MSLYGETMQPCELCGSKQTQVLYPLKDLTIVRCQRCGLVFSVLAGDREDLRCLYTQSYYQERSTYYFGNGQGQKQKNCPDFLRGLALIEARKPTGSLLDVGCALGTFLTVARCRGWQVQGVEISEWAADYARQHNQLPVYAGTLSDAQYPTESFDVVTMWDVFEHLPHPRQDLQEVWRVLKQDGLLFLDTPNERALLRRLAYWLYRASGGLFTYPVRKLYHHFHLYYYTPTTLRQLLESNGFEVLSLIKKPIPLIKVRGRRWEKAVVWMLSILERVTGQAFDLVVLAIKKKG